MATTGPHQATAIADIGDEGWGWANVANGVTDDDVLTTCNTSEGNYTDSLDFKNFAGLSAMGDSDQVTHLEFAVKCKTSAGATGAVYTARLVLDGATRGSSVTVNASVSTAIGYVSLGSLSVASQFGTTLTGAQAKSSTFGVRVQWYDGASGRTVSVDSCRATATYTAGVSTPVAAFSGTPTTGTAPLSVVFTDASTNTPTSWVWEKSSNGGVAWSNFASWAVQNPVETFAAGTWAVRLTATNAGGSDEETKLAYVVASAAGGGTAANLLLLGVG